MNKTEIKNKIITDLESYKKQNEEIIQKRMITIKEDPMMALNFNYMEDLATATSKIFEIEIMSGFLKAKTIDDVIVIFQKEIERLTHRILHDCPVWDSSSTSVGSNQASKIKARLELWLRKRMVDICEKLS